MYFAKDRKFNPQVSEEAKQVIVDFIKERRKEIGLSREELAEIANVEKRVIVSIETGRNYTIDDFLAVLGSMRGQVNFGWADIDSVAGF